MNDAKNKEVSPDAVDSGLLKKELYHRHRAISLFRHRAIQFYLEDELSTDIVKQFFAEYSKGLVPGKRKKQLRRVPLLQLPAGYRDRFILLLKYFFFRFAGVGRTFGGRNATPRNCELILSLLLNKVEQEPAIGDFLELYEQKRQRLGRRRADVWAYSDVLRTVWPVLRRKLGTIVKFAVAADWVRRQFHQ